MTRTVVALYDNFNDAQAAVEELVAVGISRDNISLVASDASGQYANRINTSSTMTEDEDVSGGEGAGFGAVVGALVGLGAMIIPGVGPVIAAGPLVAGLIGAGVGAAAGAITGGITANLIDMGVDETYANYYSEGVKRGGTLLTAQVDEQYLNTARDVMNRHNPVEIDSRSSSWGQSEFSGASTVNTGSSGSGYSGGSDDQAHLEVVEEELQVGKREVERGGVRVHTYVTETPVQEQVNLREEHVTVERHPVNRQATSADFMTGEETYEVTEMAEEPVVSKQARVVEEVVVSKDVDQRTETVSDTVRRKDVEVEQMGTGTSSAYSPFETYSAQFRNHYNTSYGSTGYGYDYYTPAYQYGYNLATDPRYGSYQWSDMESNAREHWESSNQGTWENIKDAVRHAWDTVRGRR
jgi:uncharacterized protein (TIGR02271 family)